MDCKLRCRQNEKGEREMRDMREPAIQLNKIVCMTSGSWEQSL